MFIFHKFQLQKKKEKINKGNKKHLRNKSNIVLPFCLAFILRHFYVSAIKIAIAITVFDAATSINIVYACMNEFICIAMDGVVNLSCRICSLLFTNCATFRYLSFFSVCFNFTFALPSYYFQFQFNISLYFLFKPCLFCIWLCDKISK